VRTPEAPVDEPQDANAPAIGEPSARGIPAQAVGAEPPQTDIETQGVLQSPPAPEQTPPAAIVKRTWSDDTGPAGKPVQAAEPPERQSDAGAAPSEVARQPASEEAGKPLDGAGKVVSDAARTTGEALGKAGDAVGSAAKKSWKCLTSLFGDC
jgi:hypothetical protein